MQKQPKLSKGITAKSNRLYFIRPNVVTSYNAVKTAKKLLDSNQIEEVMITSGDAGFVVKTKPITGDGSEDIESHIKRNVKCNYTHMEVHYVCRKYSKR